MSPSRRIQELWALLTQPDSLRTLYLGLALAPRLILHVVSIATLAGMFSACVPSSRYEEAKSASEVELAGRKLAEGELRATREELDRSRAELDQRAQKLAQTEQSVSESKLESTVAVKERDEATGLVDQLRGELARVGDNLRSYAAQKADLEQSLRAAQARKLELEENEKHTVAIARLTRDLTSATGDRVASGDLLLDVRDGRVLLSGAPELWLNDDGTLRTGMDLVLSGVARVLTVHPEAQLELSLPAASAESSGAALVAALSARGVAPSRVTLATGAADAKVSPDDVKSAVELRFKVN